MFIFPVLLSHLFLLNLVVEKKKAAEMNAELERERQKFLVFQDLTCDGISQSQDFQRQLEVERQQRADELAALEDRLGEQKRLSEEERFFLV